MELQDKSKTFMLQHFTWQQFLVAALILTLIWYAGVIQLFYQAAITAFLSGKRSSAAPPEPLQHVWDDDYETHVEAEENLMGKSALPDGVTKLSMAQFNFAPTMEARENEQEEEDKADENNEEQLGLVPDVLEELKSIFHILHTGNGNKEDFISLFKMVSSKYTKIRDTQDQQALNEYIRENLPFEIADEELDNLWI